MQYRNLTEKEVEQIQTITRYNPELTFNQLDNRWGWTFRHLTSKNIVGGENNFSSPLEAFAHYTALARDEADKMFDTLQELRSIWKD